MSQQFIKDMTEEHMNCYVCRKQISKLVVLRNHILKRVKLPIDTLYKIQDDVVAEVTHIPLGAGRGFVLRHSFCSPHNFKPNVEDL